MCTSVQCSRREDTSSLPVPETKFNGSDEEKLGQL